VSVGWEMPGDQVPDECCSVAADCDCAGHGSNGFEVIKHTEAKRGFVLLPRRWVVERSFAWAVRFRRLARDYERLSYTLAGYHYLAFA